MVALGPKRRFNVRTGVVVTGGRADARNPIEGLRADREIALLPSVVWSLTEFAVRWG